MDWYPIKQQTLVVKSINNSQEFAIMYQVITLGSVEGLRVIGKWLSRVPRGTDTNPSTSASIRGIGKKENLLHPCLDSIIINNSETGNSTHCMPNSLKSSLLSWAKRPSSPCPSCWEIPVVHLQSFVVHLFSGNIQCKGSMEDSSECG